MLNFVILDKNAGFLQHSCEAPDALAALASFHAEVNLGDYNSPDDWDIREVTADQRAAIEAWQDAGAPAADFPL